MAKKPPLKRRLLRWGAKHSPLAEGIAGLFLLLLPVPEPATEVATDVAGVALMADAARRWKKPRS
jgi:hypothetical protein